MAAPPSSAQARDLANSIIELPPLSGRFLWLAQFPLPRCVRVSFEVQAKSDATLGFVDRPRADVGLSSDGNSVASVPFEIVLAGWGGRKSVIRRKGVQVAAKENQQIFYRSEHFVRYFVDVFHSPPDDETLAPEDRIVAVQVGMEDRGSSSVFLSYVGQWHAEEPPLAFLGLSCWTQPVCFRNVRTSRSSWVPDTGRRVSSVYPPGFRRLLDSGALADVVVQWAGGRFSQRAHRAVLCSGSIHFSELLGQAALGTNETVALDAVLDEVADRTHMVDVLHAVIEFMYTGTARLPSKDHLVCFEHVSTLLGAAAHILAVRSVEWKADGSEAVVAAAPNALPSFRDAVPWIAEEPPGAPPSASAAGASRLADVVLHVDNVALHAPGAVLAGHSPVMYAMICGSFVESQTAHVHLDGTDVPVVPVLMFLRSLAQGKLDLAADDGVDESLEPGLERDPDASTMAAPSRWETESRQSLLTGDWMSMRSGLSGAPSDPASPASAEFNLAMWMLSLAVKYDTPFLLRALVHHLTRRLSPANVLHVLLAADEMDLGGLRAACIDFLGGQFAAVLALAENADILLHLPASVFADILDQPTLNVRDEADLARLACRWMAHDTDRRSETFVERVLPVLRFPLIDPDALDQMRADFAFFRSESVRAALERILAEDEAEERRSSVDGSRATAPPTVAPAGGPSSPHAADADAARADATGRPVVQLLHAQHRIHVHRPETALSRRLSRAERWTEIRFVSATVLRGVFDYLGTMAAAARSHAAAASADDDDDDNDDNDAAAAANGEHGTTPDAPSAEADPPPLRSRATSSSSSIALPASANAAWTNPHLAGLVTLTASSPRMRFTHVEDLVDRQFHSTAYVTGSPDAWIQVDFGAERALRCTYYTVRNDASRSGHLRSWRLQGCRNAEDLAAGKWTDVRVHENDTSLMYGGQFCAWPVRAPPHAHRYLRLIASNRIHVSQLEFYGVLVLTPS